MLIIKLLSIGLIAFSLTGCESNSSSSVSTSGCSSSDRFLAIKSSVTNAKFDSLENISVTCDETYAYINSTTYPSHNLMTNENRLKNVYVKEPSVVNTDTLLIGEEIVALPDSNIFFDKIFKLCFRLIIAIKKYSIIFP